MHKTKQSSTYANILDKQKLKKLRNIKAENKSN